MRTFFFLFYLVVNQNFLFGAYSLNNETQSQNNNNTQSTLDVRGRSRSFVNIASPETQNFLNKRTRAENPSNSFLQQLTSKSVSQQSNPKTEPIMPHIDADSILCDIPLEYKAKPWEYSHFSLYSFSQDDVQNKKKLVEVGNYFSFLNSEVYYVMSEHFLLKAFLAGEDVALVDLVRLFNKYPGAGNLLGLIYAYGVRVKSNASKAIDFFVAAYNKGFIESAIHILSMYNYNLIDNSYNRLASEASSIVSSLSSREHFSFSPGLASYQLYLYAKKEDLSEMAEEYLINSVNANYPEAIMQVLKSSSGLTEIQQFRLAQVAENAGCVDSNLFLSKFYECGNGVDKNQDKADECKNKYDTDAENRLYKENVPYLAALDSYPPLRLSNRDLHPWVLVNIGTGDESVLSCLQNGVVDNYYSYMASCPPYDDAQLISANVEKLDRINNIYTQDLGIQLLKCQITIPQLSNLIAIESGFLMNFDITSLEFPTLPNLALIQNNCMSSCMELTSVTFPPTLPSLRKIASNFLRDCSNITEVVLPRLIKLESIGHSFMAGMSGLRVLELPGLFEELKKIGAYFLSSSGIIKLILPKMPKLICIEDSFLFSSKIQELDLRGLPINALGAPNFSGKYLCANCDSLRKVTIPSEGNLNAWKIIFDIKDDNIIFENASEVSIIKTLVD